MQMTVGIMIFLCAVTILAKRCLEARDKDLHLVRHRLRAALAQELPELFALVGVDLELILGAVWGGVSGHVRVPMSLCGTV